MLGFVGTKSKPGRGRKRELKSTGNGNMEEGSACLFPLIGVNIWSGAFLMPSIPSVLMHSFLLLLAYAISLMEKS